MSTPAKMIGRHVPVKPKLRIHRNPLEAVCKEFCAAYEAWCRRRGHLHLMYRGNFRR